MTFDRITHDLRVMGGKPTIRGMRVTVGTVVGLRCSRSGSMTEAALAALCEEHEAECP